MTKLWRKRLKEKLYFTKEEIKRRIKRGEHRNLLVGQVIPYSNPSSKTNSYETVTSIYMTLTGKSLYKENKHYCYKGILTGIVHPM